MIKRQSLRVIKQSIGLILVLIYLTGCSYLAGLANVPLEPSPTVTFAQPEIPAPLDTPSPGETATLVSTHLEGLGTSIVTPQPTVSPFGLDADVTLGACQLNPVTQPPLPDKTFMPNELDRENGLHITGISQLVDLATYRLKVTGLVDHPLSLTYDDLRCMPNVTDSPELVCLGVFTDRATWTGVPIKYILDLAGIQQGATKLTLVSADGYEVNLPIKTASADDNFLAFEVNGKTLPVQHGFPLRAVFPSMWGSYWLKWLVEMRIS